MGSNCCRHKDQSPKISLRKVFSRWSHRISPKCETVKIADAEQGYATSKRRDSISDPLFDSPESEDRNHVTMLLPDAPRAPTRKKTRLTNKRVSFQSDVEIMRTASSKSLDRFTVTVVQEEPRSRSKSFDSFFDPIGLGPCAEYLKQRRTSSLEHLAIEDPQISLIAKLRRDTLGDALDFQAYKRPLILPKPEQPLIEEESDASNEEEEQIASSKLAAKLRRDTLGDALLLRSDMDYDDLDEEPTGSSTEDLEETVKHSRLCSKLRRDTFGDALRQAVHCKACSSLEDMTELEVPLPATPEEAERDFHEEPKNFVEPPKEIIISTVSNGSSDIKKQKSILKTKPTCLKCKTCMLLEVDRSQQCTGCSSNENIPETTGHFETARTANKTDSSDTKQIENVEAKPNSKKHITFTDAEISQTLEKIRTTGKIEPKEPYNLVYSSCIKGPFASSKESLNKDESSKSSSTDSLDVGIINKSDILNLPDKNRNHLIT